MKDPWYRRHREGGSGSGSGGGGGGGGKGGKGGKSSGGFTNPLLLADNKDGSGLGFTSSSSSSSRSRMTFVNPTVGGFVKATQEEPVTTNYGISFAKGTNSSHAPVNTVPSGNTSNTDAMVAAAKAMLSQRLASMNQVPAPPMVGGEGRDSGSVEAMLAAAKAAVLNKISRGEENSERSRRSRSRSRDRDRR